MATAKKRGVRANLSGEVAPSKAARAVIYAGNLLLASSRQSAYGKIIERWTDEFATVLGLAAQADNSRTANN